MNYGMLLLILALLLWDYLSYYGEIPFAEVKCSMLL